MNDDFRPYREIIENRTRARLKGNPFGRIGLTKEERINVIKNDILISEFEIFLNYLENSGSIQKLNSFDDFASNTIRVLIEITDLLKDEFDKKDWSELK